MGAVRRKRSRTAVILASVGTLASAGLLAVAGPASQLASAATGPINCDGTGIVVQSGLESVTGATLQDRTPVASSGPNLVLNGDFSYAADDSEQNAVDTANGLTRDVGSNLKKDIKDWAATGGGTSTYAIWGGKVPEAAGSGPTPGGASLSQVYFGNATAGFWSGSAFTPNSNGVWQGDTVLHPTGSAPYGPGTTYGTPETPVTVTQTVEGLTVGTAYRLQYYVTSEGGAAPDSGPEATVYLLTGVAGVDITGYNRTLFTVTHTRRYLTLDFVATSANTTIAFMSWGHIDILGPEDQINGLTDPQATEITLDDVILTECQPGTGPTPGPGPGPGPDPGPGPGPDGPGTDPVVTPRFTG